MKKKRIWFFVVAGLALGMYWLISGYVENRQKDPIYIAVSSVGDEVSLAWDTQLRESVQMYVDDVNLTGGINGHKIKVVSYIDGGNTAQAESVAQEIIASNQAMIVLANSYSDSATTIGAVLAENKIPGIASGATAPSVTENNDWMFRVINDNTAQGRFVAQYANVFFGHQSAIILYEDNTYGKSLGEAFEEEFKAQGGNILAVAPISGSSNTLDEDIAAVFTSTEESPDMVFLATYKASGAVAVLHLRENYPSIAILGGDSVGSDAFGTSVLELLGTSTSKGKLDQIYAPSEVIFDVASEDAQFFREDYFERVSEVPTWYAATSYDSVLVALEAMRAAGISGDANDLAADRQRIRDYLHNIDDPNNGIQGVTGVIYFDENHNFTHPMAMGVFENDSFISAPVQLYSVTREHLPEDWRAHIANESLIKVNNNFFGKTQIIYVGVDINEFDDVDVDGEHTYLVDFYLWFRYEGDKLNFDDIRLDNIVGNSALGEPIEEKEFDDGTNYALFRIRDTFRNTFNLSDYPFDHQILTIKLRHTAKERKDLIFVTDTLGLGNTTPDAVRNSLDQARAFETITDWYAVTGYFFADTVREFGTRGNPALFNNKSETEHSRFNAGIEIKRDVVGFTSKTMMPVFWIILLAYLGLFLPGREFDTITGLMTGTVLSVVFFHVDLSGRLNVGYTVALDYAFYAIYALLATELFLSIIAWHKSVKDEDAKSIQFIFWTMRILYPVIIVGLVIFSIFHYNIEIILPF